MLIELVFDYSDFLSEHIEMLLVICEFVWASGMSTESRNSIRISKETLSLLLFTRNIIRAISTMTLPSSNLMELSTTVTSILKMSQFHFHYLTKLSFSPHIAPICVPQRYQEFAGSRCWVSGWGKDAFETGGKYQNILKVK